MENPLVPRIVVTDVRDAMLILDAIMSLAAEITDDGDKCKIGAGYPVAAFKATTSALKRCTELLECVTEQLESLSVQGEIPTDEQIAAAFTEWKDGNGGTETPDNL